MTIQELGAIGELLGAVGVLVTLIYLTVQIKQNTRSLDEGHNLAKAQAYQARSDTAIEIFKLRDSAVLSKLGGTGNLTSIDLEKVDDLTDEERDRLYVLLSCLMVAVDNVLYQRSLGLMDQLEENYDTVRSIYPLWEKLGVNLRPAVKTVVDELGLDEKS